MSDDSTRDERLAADRRDFIRSLAALFAVAGAGVDWASSAEAAPLQIPAGAAAAPANNLVGIQMGPHTMLDEGIDRALDLIQDTAAI